MKDLTPLRYKLTSMNYYLDVIKNLFKSKKKEERFGFRKFKRGDEVKVIIYSEMPEFWYKGEVLDINARYAVPSIEKSWKVDYWVSFINSNGEKIECWKSESELEKYSLQEERNSRIEQILN